MIIKGEISYRAT